MTMPDAEVLTVAWAKANGPISTLNGQRVATRLPQLERWGGSTFLRIVHIDDLEIVEETSDVVVVLLQFDAYAVVNARPTPDYATASALARTVRAQMQLVSDLVVAGATISNFGRSAGMQRIDEEMGWARYQFDVPVSVRP